MQALRYSQKVACNGRSAQTQHLKTSCIFNQLCLHITYTITIHLLVTHIVVRAHAPLIKKLTSVFLCRKECFASVSRPEP